MSLPIGRLPIRVPAASPRSRVAPRTLALAICAAVLGSVLTSGVAAAETITETVSPCAYMEKFPDVDYRPDCRPIRTTYAVKYTPFGSASSSGSYALAVAQGHIDDARRLYVQVIARPAQAVNVHWSATCETQSAVINDFGDILSVSSTFTTRSSKRRAIRMPSGSVSCTVTASSSVTRGSLRVRLVAKVPGKKLHSERLGSPPARARAASVTAPALVASASGSGSYPSAHASATVPGARSLWVSVRTRPQRPASVSWTVDCSSDAGSGSLASGTYTSRSAALRRLRLTVPRPDQCDVGVVASTGGRGHVLVRLYAAS